MKDGVLNCRHGKECVFQGLAVLSLTEQKPRLSDFKSTVVGG